MGGGRVEELPWLGGADEFRAVQALARSGRWTEALGRAARAGRMDLVRQFQSSLAAILF